MNWAQTPFNASFAVEVKNGTGTFGVQYTLDDINAVTTATWFNDVNVGPTSTASAAGNYVAPIQFLRLNVSAISAGGIIQFTVLQGLPSP